MSIKDMNIVNFLLFLWNWISSLFFLELNLFPPPGGGAFGQNIYPWYSNEKKHWVFQANPITFTSGQSVVSINDYNYTDIFYKNWYLLFWQIKLRMKVLLNSLHQKRAHSSEDLRPVTSGLIPSTQMKHWHSKAHTIMPCQTTLKTLKVVMFLKYMILSKSFLFPIKFH